MVKNVTNSSGFLFKPTKSKSDAIRKIGDLLFLTIDEQILSNFFFARDNTKTPFYISIGIVIANISISICNP